MTESTTQSEQTTQPTTSSASIPSPSIPSGPRKRGRKSYAEQAAMAGMPLEEWLQMKGIQPTTRRKSQTTEPTQPSEPDTREDGTRIFPENVAEQEKILRRYKPFARMVTTAISKGCEVMGTSPLDESEKENGDNAFAQLLYEEGANLSARVLVALFLITTLMPRLIEWLDKKKESKQSMLTRVEKEVKGERVS